ncbi:hypothetical protein ACCQ08_03270 [Comamonas sp. SY3]|uniref:hypothetical protein n=1 Tax=Comamonas sp. SY3 TaxID=3243601 RepID=UPI0035930474
MRGFQPAVKSKAAKPFANGGPVRGPGTGTSDEVADEVPNGTYIMPADSTQAVGQGKLATMGADAKGVPVQLSDGEFKMPPEQVHAIGVQALDQMKNATHTPVAPRGFSAGAPGAPQQPEPPLFFADGGVVDKEERRRRQTSPTNTFPGSRLPGDSGFSSAPAGAAAAPAPVPTPAVPATAAPSPANTFPGNRLQGDSGATGAPVTGVSPPAASTAAFPAAAAVGLGAPAASPTTQPPLPAAPATTEIPKSQQILNSMLVGPAATRGEQARQTMLMNQAQRAAGSERYEAGAAQMAQEARDAAFARQRQSVTRSMAGTPKAPASTGLEAAKQWDAANPTFAKPADPAPAPDQPRGLPGYNYQTQGEMGPPDLSGLAPSPSATAPATGAAPAEPPVNQVLPGVYRTGNSYGDSAEAARAGAQTRGLPSPQNMAAADALAQRSEQESVARISAAQSARGMGAVAGDGPGWSGVIGTDPGADRERRELVSSFMTPLKGSQNGQLTAAQRNGMLALMNQESQAQQAAERNATALQQTQMGNSTQRDIAAMREVGDTGRAVMRETGESGRANARNNIDQGRLNLEQQVRGFDIRSGERQEALYKKYDAAKTPEEKAAIAQQVRDLSGKQTESPWKIQVTPATKNVDGSTSEGSIYRYNGQTGAVERVDTGAARQTGPSTPQTKAEYDALPKGAQYIKDGKVLVKS